jgi:hypothetical protein
MCSTNCSFDDASLLADEPAMIETTESASIVEEEEYVEGVGKIQQRIDSTMCNTTCILDDTSLLTDVPAIIETTESASIVVVEDEDDEESLEGVEKLIHDLSNSDNAKVNAALDALFLDIDKDKEKCDTVTAWGGCGALVHLLKDRLKKAMKKVPVCAQATELNELTTLHKTLNVIIILTFQHDESRVGISAIGGVEQVVKIMKTFPECQALQGRACAALRNLAGCSIGTEKAIESSGIEVLLATINNHYLGSAILCENACSALGNIARESKENLGLFISLGGATAVAKVRTKWPDNDGVQTQMRRLASLMVMEMKTWAH